jgi:hypothetical protein
LPGWTIYLDLDHSGTPTAGDHVTTTDQEGNYAFTDLDPFATYTVAEVPQVGFEQTMPVRATGDVSIAQFASDPKFQTLIDITSDDEDGFFLTGMDGQGGGFNAQEIFHVGLTGDDPKSLTAANLPEAVATGGRWVYWTERSSDGVHNSILRTSLDSGQLQRIYDGASGQTISSPVGLDLVTRDGGGATLVTTDMAGGRVFAMNATSPVSAIVQLGPPRYGNTRDREHPSFVAVDAGTVYVADPGLDGFGDTAPRVQSIPLAGGQWTDLYVGDLATFSPQGIVVHDGTIYLTSGSQVLQMPTSGGVPTLLAADPRWGSLRGLEYHNGALYVIDNGDGNGATVWKVDLTPSFSVTADGAYVFPMAPGRIVTNADFGNRDPNDGSGVSETGRILGRQFQDLDGDGNQDSGEAGLPGWTVYLDLNNNGILDPREPSTLTLADDPETPDLDETGLYVFANLADRDYMVDVIAPQGWQRTWPRDIAFVPAEVRAGEKPQSVTTVDVDGNGRPDLVVTNPDNNQLLPLQNAGDGSFTAGSRLDVGIGPVQVAAGQWNDDNGDGRIDGLDYLDMASANSLNFHISVLRGQAGGGFAQSVPVPAGGQLSSLVDIVGAELTGDAFPDLAVVDWYAGKVHVLRNDGTATFQKVSEHAVGNAPQAIVAADFNGDGHPDLAVANQASDTVSILLYDAVAGSFRAATPVTVGTQPVALDAGDLDGDGDVDLAVANLRSDTVTVLGNDGSGVFGPLGTPLAVGRGPMSLAVAKMDEDNLPDIVVSNTTSRNVSVLFNAGGGLFERASSFGAANFSTVQSYSLSTGDFDLDGDMDVALANGSTGTVSILISTPAPGVQRVNVTGGGTVAGADFGSQLANAAPTLDEIPDPAKIMEGAGVQILPLTSISAGSGESQPLAIVAFSSNPGLIPHPAVDYTSPATTGSLQYTPEANEFGEAVITVTVTDGGRDGNLATTLDNGSISRMFRVVVTEFNLAPTEINLDGNTVVENVAGATLGLVTVVDPDVLDIHSFVVSDSRFEVVGGQLKLRAGQALDYEAAASVLLNITATDRGGLSVTRGFTILVTDIDEPPRNLTLSPSAILENTSTAVGPVAVGTLSATDPEGRALVYSLVSGAGATDNDAFEIAGDQLRVRQGVVLDHETKASYAVRVRVTDGTQPVEQPLVVQVTNVYEPPTVSDIADRTIEENFTVGPLAFTISGPEAGPGGVQVSVSSDNPALVPQSSLVLGGSGSQRTLRINPMLNQFGLATITITVSDGISTGSDTFRLTVTPATTFKVAAFTPTSTGFVVRFNRSIDVGVLNLYDQGLPPAPADVTLVGATGGALRGSIVVDPALRQFAFIKTGGVLAADTYGVTLISGVSAVHDAAGFALDGNADGSTGDNYTTSFVVPTPPANRVTVSLPDFARGYGQPVNLPANDLAAGIPLTLSTGLGVSGLDLTLRYDPGLLTIQGFTLNPTLAAAGVQASLTLPSTGTAILTVSGPQSLSGTAGTLTLGTLSASVPNTAAYGAKHVLDICDLHVYDASPELAELPSVDDDAIHVAAFFGDNNGSRTYNAPDVTLVQRLIGQINTGFSAYQLADPLLLADITLNGKLQASDTVGLQRLIGQVPVANVPALPSGITPPAATGADPKIYIPQDLRGSPGDTVTVPVKLLVTEPAGITLSGFDLVLEFDPNRLTVGTAQLGTLLADQGFQGLWTSPASGILIYTASSAAGTGVLPYGSGGELVNVAFTIAVGAGAGSTNLNLRASFQATVTAAFDNDLSELLLMPAPSNAADDRVDGRLTVQGTESARSPSQNPVQPLDANGDGDVTPSDALAVINHINDGRPQDASMLYVAPGEPIRYVDVNGDRWVSAQDVLVLVNRLNGQAAGNGEAEGDEAALCELLDEEDDDSLWQLLAEDRRGGEAAQAADELSVWWS